MKLGLLTVPFGDRTLSDVASWAGRNGFEALEVAAWPSASGSQRRYAGISHLDAETLTADGAKRLVDDLAERGVTISALGYYPNPLDPDDAKATAAREHLVRLFDAAKLLGVNLVNTFVGGDQRKTVDENFDVFLKVFPELVHRAGDVGVHVAIENCPMIFSADEWPAGVNIAYSPQIWKRMFEALPDENFGINFDPSHLIWQFIDIPRAVRELGARIKHVHAKDLEIDRNGLYEHGIMSAGIGWQIPRLCGLGEVDWGALFGALYSIGYDNVAVVEHEDRAFEGSDDAIERGFRIARDTLRPFVH